MFDLGTIILPSLPRVSGTTPKLMTTSRSHIRSHIARAVRLLGAALFTAACTEATDPEPIATIQLTPGLDSVEVGATYAGWVTIIRDAAGIDIAGRRLTWESQNTSVATIDATTGTVTGVAAGQSLITVRGETKFANATIKVMLPVVSIVASVDSFDLPLTTTRTISATIVGPGGVALTNRLITWSSSSPGIAVVSPAGVVTPVGQGTATITIRAGTKQKDVRVRVVTEPATSVRLTPQASNHILRVTNTKQFVAECLNATQQVLQGRTITWNSSNPIAASVNGSGLVSANAVGQSNLTATCDNSVSATTLITVTPIPVSSVTISPPNLSLSLNQPGPLPQSQLLATAKDSAGNTLSLQGRQVVWFSNNQPIADVSQSGVVTGRSIGTAQVTVTVDGVSSAPVTVSITAFFELSAAWDAGRRRLFDVLGLR